MNFEEFAAQNLQFRLQKNSYPGRGIVMGINKSGSHLIQIYWIMGRSENSRNRIFKLDHEIVKTVPKDVSKVTNPELIIYQAIRQLENCHIVSNGVQTDTIYKALQDGYSFETGFKKHIYEPDSPNFTPRIAGLINLNTKEPGFQMAIVKKSLMNTAPIYNIFEYSQIENGYGYCLHTYEKDETPLPPFSGESYLVPIANTLQEIAQQYWQCLDMENKISLAVKGIEVDSLKVSYHIINK
ncbi:inosine monophosphate cyclohydrolase [candidate division KSB1 bacterium]|nr:inosine monophosphate cyclohydrolase [candidate division KSB1 bacterium]